MAEPESLERHAMVDACYCTPAADYTRVHIALLTVSRLSSTLPMRCRTPRACSKRPRHALDLPFPRLPFTNDIIPPLPPHLILALAATNDISIPFQSNALPQRHPFPTSLSRSSPSRISQSGKKEAQ